MPREIVAFAIPGGEASLSATVNALASGTQARAEEAFPQRKVRSCTGAMGTTDFPSVAVKRTLERGGPSPQIVPWS